MTYEEREAKKAERRQLVNMAVEEAKKRPILTNNGIISTNNTNH